jgi:hypothetical protein
MSTCLDHLVVIAADLASGVAWCEQTLGVRPGAGGEHPLMGTHNRLLKIADAGFEDAYLEIISLQPGATPQLAPGRKRWFDLDDLELMQRIQAHGPQLAHWVVRTDMLPAACAAWQRLGIDRGAPVTASRMTPDGLLEWQITVREDGARLFDGGLPTLIQWGAVHPARTMADSGVRLQSVEITHPQSALLLQAFASAGLTQVKVAPGAARLRATLTTPRGTLTI